MKLWRGQPDNWSWKPSAREKGRFWLGLAGVSYSLAAVSFLTPGSSSFTGRWGWLHRTFFDAFGPKGDVILFAFIGTACLTYGLLKHRSDE
jgi:hypothetical protein